MTELRSVDAILLEAFEENNFRLVKEFPPHLLVNMVDNLGAFYRDYPEFYPRFMPLLAAICVSQS